MREETWLAIAVLALAGLIGLGAWLVPAPPPHVKVGPSVLPVVVAVLMLVLGIGLLIAALKGGWIPAAERDEPVSYLQLGWVLLGLAVNVALIERVGFTLASTLLFVCVARGFGSRRPLRDAAIAVVFAAIVYLGFDVGLGIRIGAGPIFGGVI
jgi:putative tricarboxylic transport membrane protein